MSRIKTTITLSASAFLLMVGVGMIVALLPRRVYEASGSLESVSLIASVFAIAYLVTQLPVGLLSDRFGAKPFLIAGYCLCGVAGLVFFVFQSAGMILVGRVIQGIGEAPVWALGPALLAITYPDAKGRAIGTYNAAIHAGLTLGPLTGLLIASSGQSQIPFLLFAALSFTGGCLILLVLPHDLSLRSRRQTTRLSARQFAKLVKSGRLRIILVGILLYGACYGAMVSVLPVSLALTNGFDARATGILFIVFYAAISVSQLIAGPLSDRVGRGGFVAGGLLLAAFGYAAFPSVPGYWTYVPIGVASLGLGLFGVASLAELNDRVPANLKGTISANYYLAWSLGYMLGPLGIGYASTLAPGLGYHLLAAVLLAHAVISWSRRA